MKQLKHLIILCVLHCACNSSESPDCFQQAGENSTEWRTVSAYEGIEIHDNIRIILVDSEEEKIRVVGPRNLIPEIATEVVDGKLRIENNNTCNFVRSYKHTFTVTVYGRRFAHVVNHGTGDLSSANTLRGTYVFLENKRSMGKIDLDVEVDSVRLLNTAGYSDIRITGQARWAYLFHQGVGMFDARDLRAERAFVNNNSINDIYVWYIDYMYASIQDRGNIYYRGWPGLIDADHLGSGSLIALN